MPSVDTDDRDISAVHVMIAGPTAKVNRLLVRKGSRRNDYYGFVRKEYPALTTERKQRIAQREGRRQGDFQYVFLRQTWGGF